MGYIFDIILIAVLVISIVLGIKKGMAAELYSLVAIIAAIVLANMFSPYVATYLQNAGLETKISDLTSAKIIEFYNNSESGMISIDEVAEDLNIPSAIVKTVSGTIDTAAETVAEETAENIGKAVGSFTIELLSFAIVAAAVIIVLIVVGLLLKLVVKLPVISSIDKIGGFIVGTARGIALVYLLCVVLYLINIYAGTTGTAEFANSSFIMKLVANLGWLK